MYFHACTPISNWATNEGVEQEKFVWFLNAFMEPYQAV